MKSDKVRDFIELTGRALAQGKLQVGEGKDRELGAQLLLSEVLEYVIKGLGVVPHINGQPITDPEAVTYKATHTPAPLDMVDGLADVAYTMYWNALTFGVKIEEAFDAVCDNNLTKFVSIEKGELPNGPLDKSKWGCNRNVSWPEQVTNVTVLDLAHGSYAVGRDVNGKVRKPSTYQNVDLGGLI